MVEQEQFDIACLRGLATDVDAKRIALSAAMIKMLALGMARAAPDLRDDALRIVEHTTQLFRVMPSRSSIQAVLDEHLPRARRSGAFDGPRVHVSEGLVEALWQHFQVGVSR